MINNQPKSNQFGFETTGYGFHIVNNWLVCLTCGLISLVKDYHMDNSLEEILAYVNFGLIVNNPLKKGKLPISVSIHSQFLLHKNLFIIQFIMRACQAKRCLRTCAK